MEFTDRSATAITSASPELQKKNGFMPFFFAVRWDQYSMRTVQLAMQNPTRSENRAAGTA